MIAVLKLFFFTLKTVRLIPSKHTEPFSIMSSANFLGDSNSNSQLPFFFFLETHFAVASICPCTKCPSNLESIFKARSRFTNCPIFQSFKLVLLRVSSMAVTRCLISFLKSFQLQLFRLSLHT